jgi:hypothetical protein
MDLSIMALLYQSYVSGLCQKALWGA